MLFLSYANERLRFADLYLFKAFLSVKITIEPLIFIGHFDCAAIAPTIEALSIPIIGGRGISNGGQARACPCGDASVALVNDLARSGTLILTATPSLDAIAKQG